MTQTTSREGSPWTRIAALRAVAQLADQRVRDQSGDESALQSYSSSVLFGGSSFEAMQGESNALSEAIPSRDTGPEVAGTCPSLAASASKSAAAGAPVAEPAAGRGMTQAATAYRHARPVQPNTATSSQTIIVA